MKKKLLTKIFSALCFMLLSSNMYGEDINLTVNNFHYTLHENGTATFVGVKSEKPQELELGNVVIPATISNEEKEYQIVTIGKQAFYKCEKLTSVIIPEGVNKIEGEAFRGCTALKDITIPPSVTQIGAWALLNTAWLENQPNGIVYINSVLYEYIGDMPAETSITVKEGIVTIAERAFFNYKNLVSITLPASLKRIGRAAFVGCENLKELLLPENLQYIGSNIIGKKLKKIIIPASVVYMEDNISADEVFFQGLTPPETSPECTPRSESIYYVPYHSHIEYYNARLVPLGTVNGEKPMSVKTLEGETIYPIIVNIESGEEGGTILINKKNQLQAGVKEGDEAIFDVVAKDGYLINKIWFDGLKVPIRAENMSSFSFAVISAPGGYTANVSFISKAAISNQEADAIRVYASNGTLKIENANEMTPVTILNLAGQSVYQGTTDNYEAVSLPSGMYLVKVGTETHKVVIK